MTEPIRAYAAMNTIRALELLARAPMSGPQIVDALQISHRNARRMLQRLELEGYIVQERDHRRRYHATLRLAALGRHVESRDIGGRCVWRCPECGRVASVRESCSRPICLHAWDACAPEIWDGDDTDGNGRPIEQTSYRRFRRPGPSTWAEMLLWAS